MIISLDYDDTFTKDPVFWSQFIKLANEHGHMVYGVTMRYPEECRDPAFIDYANKVNTVFPTSRKGKKEFMSDVGIWIDVWIDDRPEFILNDSC